MARARQPATPEHAASALSLQIRQLEEQLGVAAPSSSYTATPPAVVRARLPTEPLHARGHAKGAKMDHRTSHRHRSSPTGSRRET